MQTINYNGMTYGNGLHLAQDINNRQLPTRLRAGAALDLQYSYDARSDVTNITDWRNRSRDRHMNYDGLVRLTSANGVWGNGNYRYDALGNLQQKRLGNRVVNISYDRTKNRATRSTDTAGNTRTINYDNRGNVTRLGTQYFTYDQANQPSAITGSANGNYTYDGNFKRVKAEIDGKTIYNVYDASGSLVHIDSLSGTRTLTVCTETCKNISIASSGATDYIRANGMTIARLTNDQPTYLHPNLLGSPVAATDQQGNISWQEHYTPYGEKWGTTNAANDDQMGFTGHISDSATGLTYMQARYYDPVSGRFLSNDPVGFLGHLKGAQGVQGFNRYAYVNNSPFRYVDPDGEKSYLVSRPLSFTNRANHNFIVHNAKFLGNPSATVRSFGDIGNDTMGEVTADTKGFSEGTSDADSAAWNSLNAETKKDGSVDSVTSRKINSTDEQVKTNADALEGGQEYSAVPGLQGGVNSNSAAGAIAHRSDGGASSVDNRKKSQDQHSTRELMLKVSDMKKNLIKVIVVLVFFLAGYPLYLWITYIDETVTVGSAYGFDIGASKQDVYKNLPLLSNEIEGQVFIKVESTEETSLILATAPGYHTFIRPMFHNVGYSSFERRDEWRFYIDASYFNSIELKFCEDRLCRIYRHRKYFEFP